jgi:hypothetical protein
MKAEVYVYFFVFFFRGEKNESVDRIREKRKSYTAHERKAIIV